MLNKEITFDRFIRGVLVVLGATAAILLINRLSAVLLPFFIAWLLAYLIYPLVHFIQYKCRVKIRALSILLALIIVVAAIVGLFALIIPPTIKEFSQLEGAITGYIKQLGASDISAQVNHFLREYFDNNSFMKLLQEKSFIQIVQLGVGQVWGIISGTLNFIIGVVGSLIVLLYMVFILLDYEKISQGWKKLIPGKQRHFASMIVSDVERGMNAYFRGQALVAFCVGVLFSIGFLIIGFPLAIGLGMFIGLLNMVPYMQMIGFIPTILLALLKSYETGQNFWWILIPALAVFCVVQLIQDLFLVPKIMGKVMGLNPAVILLSLSVWGSLLGIIGLIIALPLTTLLLSYYRRYILEEVDEKEPAETENKEK